MIPTAYGWPLIRRFFPRRAFLPPPSPRHLGIREENVDDVKLAISEACTNAIGAGLVDWIGIDMYATEAGALVRVSGIDPDETTEFVSGVGVIEALFGPIMYVPERRLGCSIEFSITSE